MPEITSENMPCPACGHAHANPSQLTFDYLSQSERTCGPTFYGDQIALSNFIGKADAAVTLLASLDDIKKVLFYGRHMPHVAVTTPVKPTLLDLSNRLADNFDGDQQIAVDVIHAIIGKATEAGELLELLINFILNPSNRFDSINALEEIGDGLWYDALLLRALDSDFDQVMQKNIAKLRTRFPKAFTEHDANNRDLKAERVTLEGTKHDAT